VVAIAPSLGIEAVRKTPTVCATMVPRVVESVGAEAHEPHA